MPPEPYAHGPCRDPVAAVCPKTHPEGHLNGARTRWGPMSSRTGAAMAPNVAGATVSGCPAATGCSPVPSARCRSQRQVRKHVSWIYSCQVLSATQLNARRRCCEH